MGWVSWPLYIFVFLASFSALWWPNIWPKMGFPELFEKTIGSIHFISGIYPYGVSLLTLFIFVFLASFSALWWPNIWPKMGSPELFEKTIGSIHFIPVIYPYGVSMLTPIHFRVPSLIFVPLGAKYFRVPTCVAHDCKIEIFYWYFWMIWVVIRAGVYCPHLWAQLVSLVLSKACWNSLIHNSSF